MATLYVRNVPADVMEYLASRARDNHRSVSAEVVAVLESASADGGARRERDLALARIGARAMLYAKADAPTAAEMVREDRGR